MTAIRRWGRLARLGAVWACGTGGPDRSSGAVKVSRPRPLVDDVLVSVIVPCYNYGHFLADAVGSALGQDGVRVEVLIVDDASTDNTPEVADASRSRPSSPYPHARAEQGAHPDLQRWSSRQRSGDHVTLLSADDLLAPGALARAAALLEHEDVGMVYGLPLGFEDARPKPRHRPESWTVWPGQQWLRALCWRGRNFIMSPEVVVRGEMARQIGGYNPALPHSADLEYWIRVAARAGVGRVNGPAQAYYRDHAANMHLTEFATMPVDLTPPSGRVRGARHAGGLRTSRRRGATAASGLARPLRSRHWRLLGAASATEARQASWRRTSASPRRRGLRPPIAQRPLACRGRRDGHPGLLQWCAAPGKSRSTCDGALGRGRRAMSVDVALARRVRRGAAWGAAGVGVSRLLQFVTTMALARLIAPEAFGLLAVAITIQTIALNASELGATAALGRGDRDPDEIAPTVWTIALSTSAALTAVMFFSAGPLAEALGQPDAAAAVRVMSFVVMFSGMSAVPTALIWRDFHQGRRLVIELIGSLITGVLAIILAVAGWETMALAWSRTIGAAVVAVLFISASPRRYLPGFDRHEARGILRLGAPLAAANIVVFAILNVDYVVIGRQLDARVLGIYLLAFNLAALPSTVLTQVLRTVAVPTFGRLHATDRLGTSVGSVVTLVCAAAFGACAALAAVGGPALETLYGSDYGSAATVLVGAVRLLGGASRDRGARRPDPRCWSDRSALLAAGSVVCRLGARHGAWRASTRYRRCRDRTCGRGVGHRRPALRRRGGPCGGNPEAPGLRFSRGRVARGSRCGRHGPCGGTDGSRFNAGTPAGWRSRRQWSMSRWFVDGWWLH